MTVPHPRKIQKKLHIYGPSHYNFKEQQNPTFIHQLIIYVAHDDTILLIMLESCPFCNRETPISARVQMSKKNIASFVAECSRCGYKWEQEWMLSTTHFRLQKTLIFGEKEEEVRSR